MSRRILYLFFFLFCTGSSSGFSDPAISVSISRDIIPFSETTRLTIQAEWPRSEGSYQFALPPLIARNLILIQQGESQETFVSSGQEWTRKTFTLEFRAGEPGPGSIAGFVLPYVNPASQSTGEFSTGELRIMVQK